MAAQREAQLVLVFLRLRTHVVQRAAPLADQVVVPLAEHLVLEGQDVSGARLDAVLVEGLLVQARLRAALRSPSTIE